MARGYRVYLHGGSSYSSPDWAGKPDWVVSSVKEASRLLDMIIDSPRFPEVSAIPPEVGGPELVLFRADNDSDIPDFSIFFGPRCGIRVARL